jgi:hypothetical protein
METVRKLKTMEKTSNSKPSYVFIVGVGRSGTKFLQSILTAHPELHVSTETHFLSSTLHNGFIKTANKIGDLKDDKHLEILVEKMFSGEVFGAFWKRKILKDKESVLQKFKNSDRSFRSLYQIILEEDTLQNNKSIPGEKTPSHLYHVDTLLNWFPDAKVIHIIRNPRNVLASEIHKNLKPDHPLKKGTFFYNTSLLFYVLINWNNAAKLDKKYKKKYPGNYLAVKYEDLMNDHENNVLQICKFLNVDFRKEMLNPPVRGSSFATSENHSSKKKKELPNKQFNSIINLFLRKKLKQYDYLN